MDLSTMPMGDVDVLFPPFGLGLGPVVPMMSVVPMMFVPCCYCRLRDHAQLVLGRVAPSAGLLAVFPHPRFVIAAASAFGGKFVEICRPVVALLVVLFLGIFVGYIVRAWIVLLSPGQSSSGWSPGLPVLVGPVGGVAVGVVAV